MVATPKDTRHDEDDPLLVAAELLNALAVIKGRAQLMYRHVNGPKGASADELLAGLRDIDRCTGRIQSLFYAYQEAASWRRRLNGRDASEHPATARSSATRVNAPPPRTS